jgi:hypothetical protein
MKRLGLILIVLMGVPDIAHTATDVSDQVCFTDAEKVRKAHPGMYPSYTMRMSNHKGEKCWFPAEDRHHKKWTQVATRTKSTNKSVKASPETVKEKAYVKRVEQPSIESTMITPPEPRYVNNFDDRFGAAYGSVDELEVWAKKLF